MINYTQKACFMMLALSIVQTFELGPNATHPKVEDTKELLCFQGHNVVDEVCTIENGSVVFQRDATYDRQDLKALIIKNSKIVCKSTNGAPCDITFRLNKNRNTQMSLLQGSSISGAKLLIDSPTTNLTIDATSNITVNGRSLMTTGSWTGQGASYVGQGGYCGDASSERLRNYGQYDMMPDPNNLLNMKGGTLLGSVGQSSPLNVQTGGGGHIHLNIDALNLVGENNHIQANGLPEKDLSESDVGDLNGGSGGYININIENKYVKQNHIDYLAKIQALGGHGKNKGVGGAGGIITFGNNVEYLNLEVTQTFGGSGGTIRNAAEQPNCGNGAPGTVFYDQINTLQILNNQLTSKQVFINAKINSPKKFPGQYLIADNFIMGMGARVSVRNNAMKALTIDQMTLLRYSDLIFDFTNTFDLTIYYNQYLNLFNDFTSVDFTKINGQISIKQLQPQNERTSIILNDVKFSYMINIDVRHLAIHGNIYDPSESNSRRTQINLQSQSLFVKSGAKIRADKIFMYTNGTIDIHEGAEIQSSKANQCETQLSTDLKNQYFQCFDVEYQMKELSDVNILDFYNEQYKYKQGEAQYAKQISEIIPGVMKKWDVYILAVGTLRMTASSVNGPRIGICGDNLLIFNSSIDANARGCAAGTGPGAGKQVRYCAGSGGAHAGYGGYGGSESSDAMEKATCMRNMPKPYSKGQLAIYEGSGGGNGEKRANQADTGGSGGGIVWLNSPNTLLLNNSTVQADGGWGTTVNFDQYGAGGGAGGSVQIITQNLRGDGYISARGGAGSINGGGGGSGGRFVLNYLKSYLADSQPLQSKYWTGSMNIQGGAKGAMRLKYLPPIAGENGTMIHSKCFPGYDGVFCSPCPTGFYKFDYSYGKCQPCLNKPYYSEYVGDAEGSSICQYKCSKYFESVATNPDCLDPISLSVQRVGGQKNFFGLLFFFLVLALAIFFTLMQRNKIIAQNQKLLKEQIYSDWAPENDPAKRATKTTNERDFDLDDPAIWHHYHRMYIIGQNSIKFPWIIPKDFPKDALKKEDRDKLIKFIDYYNDRFKWSIGERAVFAFVGLVCPPLAKFMHSTLRRNKYEQLQSALYRNFSPQFWGNKGDNKTIRLGCSKSDYRLAYIDFIDFKKTYDNFQGVKVPMTIIISGSGTFNTPYHLEFKDDPYAKQIVLINYDFMYDKLPPFLENFNSQLAKLSFYKLEVLVMRDLSNVVQWIEKANRTMFNHYHIKACLYLIENQFTEPEPGVFKQKRKSFPLESIFFEAFPEMYATLLSYIRARQIANKSEIKLALTFKRFTKKKFIQDNLRINEMKQKSGKNSFKVAVEKQESILFDEHDNDQEDSKITVVDGVAQHLRAPSSGSADVESQGTPGQSQGEIKKPKLVDRSLRAFAISVDSSKAFELAIRKPRNKAKHHINRIRGGLYSIFLLLIKHHGSPSDNSDITWFYAAMSFIVSLDIILLMNFTLHISYPLTNYNQFGWAFVLMPPLVPYMAPVAAIAACASGSIGVFRTVNNLNAITVLINIPLTMLLAISSNDDPVFVFLLLIMIFVKTAFSSISAKIAHSLSNPKYMSNQEKIKKIFKIQRERVEKRNEVLGMEVSKQISGMGMFPSYLPKDKQTAPVISRAMEARMRERLLQ